MAELNSSILDQLSYFIGGLIVAIVILFIWNLVQGTKLRKLRKKYATMMNGTGVDNLEDLLIDLKVQQDQMEDLQEAHKFQLQRLNELMPKQIGKIGIRRYNAFGERGNDLSFSVALVNDEKDGVVITGLYSRDGSYVYAKAIAKGDSSHTLSSEEKEAIALAGQEGDIRGSTPE